jgi:hypothetical protein
LLHAHEPGVSHDKENAVRLERDCSQYLRRSCCESYNRTECKFEQKFYHGISHCAAGHTSQDCGKKDDCTAFHCIPCRKQGHVSWARECPIWKRQVEKAQQAYACRPSKFQVRAASPRLTHTATATAATTQRAPQPSTGGYSLQDGL